MSQAPQMQAAREKLIYLRQFVGSKVAVMLTNANEESGVLTNIVFDGTRLMYIMLNDQVCLNFDHVVSIKQTGR